jgi:hypothetical protein
VIALIEGRGLDAIRLYDQATHSGPNGFVHNEAIS